MSDQTGCKHGHPAHYKRYCRECEIEEDFAEADAWCEYWRREAFRKYPTPDAYDSACAALEQHRKRAVEAEAEVQRLREALSQIANYQRDQYESALHAYDNCKIIARDALSPQKGETQDEN